MRPAMRYLLFTAAISAFLLTCGCGHKNQTQPVHRREAPQVERQIVAQRTGVASVLIAGETQYVDVVTGSAIPPQKARRLRFDVLQPALEPITGNGRSRVSAGDITIETAQESRHSVVILSEKSKRRVLLTGREPVVGDFRIVKWTPDLSLTLIQQGLDTRTYLYDRTAGRTEDLGRGCVAQASVVGRDALAFVMHDLQADLKWRPAAAFPGEFDLYRAGLTRPLVKLDSVNGDSYNQTYPGAQYGQRSPDGSRLAITRVTRDAFGDYDNFELDVIDLANGKCSVIPVSGHHISEFCWLTDSSLAYVECDKYQVPALRIFDLETGGSRLIFSKPEFGAIKPVGYYPAGKRIVFETCIDPLVSKTMYDALWSVAVDGRAPKKLVDMAAPAQPSPRAPKPGAVIPKSK